MNFETRDHPADGSPMVLVPAGPFRMGRPDHDLFAEPDEKPEREVHLSAFWIDVYPVTNGRFRRFLEAGGYDQERWWCPAGWAWRREQAVRQPHLWGRPGWDGSDQPAAGVSWFEADAYARWAGRRLPTDAEWEKAARGPDGRLYPWGDDWPTGDRANFALLVGRTTPVGLYPAGVSPYGCHDMAGNVNNWTADWYWPAFARHCGYYGLHRDPRMDDGLKAQIGPTTLTDKVDRGGGFATARECHEVLSCTHKLHWPPHARQPWNGFRTALGQKAEGGRQV